MLDELMAEQQFKQVREADRNRLAMEAEARALYGDPGVRTRIAGALVTVGGWLDHGVIDRAAGGGRALARPERGLR